MPAPDDIWDNWQTENSGHCIAESLAYQQKLREQCDKQRLALDKIARRRLGIELNPKRKVLQKRIKKTFTYRIAAE